MTVANHLFRFETAAIILHNPYLFFFAVLDKFTFCTLLMFTAQIQIPVFTASGALNTKFSIFIVF